MSEASRNQGASLESKLADLMKALRANNKDEWEGKPDQSQDNPFAPATAGSKSTTITTITTTDDTVEIQSSTSQPTRTQHQEDGPKPLVQVCRTSGDNALDDLMRTYMQHVAQVRRLDAEKQQATADAEQQHTEASQESEKESNAEMDFSDLLKQLDELPPLEKKKDC